MLVGAGARAGRCALPSHRPSPRYATRGTFPRDRAPTPLYSRGRWWNECSAGFNPGALEFFSACPKCHEQADAVIGRASAETDAAIAGEGDLLCHRRGERAEQAVRFEAEGAGRPGIVVGADRDEPAERDAGPGGDRDAVAQV